MLLDRGGRSACAAFPYHITHRRPDDETPPCRRCTILACRQASLGARGSTHYSLELIHPQAHPFFAEIADLRVSAYCLIRRDGEIVQYVPFHKRAWHAGALSIRGANAAMIFLLGFQVLKAPDTLAYTDAQYQQLAGGYAGTD
ncbi:N-acetylmuramoyl-L-alanine amidase [Shigella flexneri]